MKAARNSKNRFKSLVLIHISPVFITHESHETNCSQFLYLSFWAIKVAVNELGLEKTNYN